MSVDPTAVRSVIRELDITSEDADYDYWTALQADEGFAAAADRYAQADLYVDHEHATAADREARDALKRSVREHAQRVAEEVQD
jgi:hypothetical protein